MPSVRRALINCRKFERLSATDRRLFLQAIVILPITSMALRLAGFRRCHVLLMRLVRRREQHPTDPEDRRRLSRAIARVVRLAASYGPWRPKCLAEALVLWSLLRTQGLEGEIVIGVHKSDRDFQAHAWVTFGELSLSRNGNCDGWFVTFGRPIL